MLGQRPKHEIASIIRVRRRRRRSSSSTFLTHYILCQFSQQFVGSKGGGEEWESKSTSFVLGLLGNKARKQQEIGYCTHRAINIFPGYLQRVRN